MKEDSNLKGGLWVGGGLLLALVVLSCYYWQERTIIIDAAFQMFRMLRTEQLPTQAQRFGAAVVQFMPWLGMKMQWSLSAILQSYSLSFTLYPILFFLLLIKPLQQYRTALAIALFFGLIQVHTFFWIQSELIIGCLFSIFFLGLLFAWERLSIIRILILGGGIVTIVYVHPLSWVPLLYVWLFWLLEEDRRQNRYLVFGLPIVLALTLTYKFAIAPMHHYDAGALNRLDDLFSRLINITSLESTQFFFKRLFSTYYLLVVALGGVLFFYIRSKAWFKGLMVFGAVVVWLLLILTTFHQQPEPVYLESYFLVLSLLLSVPLCLDVLPSIRSSYVVAGILIIVALVRITQIQQASHVYVERLAWEKRVLEDYQSVPERRLLMRRSQAPLYLLQMEWAMPYESMLLSSLPGEEFGQSLIIVPDEQDVSEMINMKTGFPTLFGSIEYEWINHSPYLEMTDTLPVRILGPQ